MDELDFKSAIEGILFAAGEPVSIKRIAQVMETEEDKVDKAAKALADEYSFQRRGIRIVKLDDCYQMCSSPEHGEIIRKTLENRKPPKLSQSALEALTIVAYYQPTTRAFVDKVRGVDSSYTMGLLLERGLIEEAGRMNVPGRPILYKTTKDFLRVFGLASLEELPPMPESQIMEKLTAQTPEEQP